MKDVINNITGMIKRAYITLVGSDKDKFQTTQVNYLDKTADIEVIYPYGLCGNPPKNSIVLLFNVQAQEENRAGICNLPNKRFKDLKEGEVVVGNYLTGSYVKFLENGDVKLLSKNKYTIIVEESADIEVENNANIKVKGKTTLTSNQTEINSPTTINGNLTVNGDITSGSTSISGGTITTGGDVIGAGISLTSHVHGGITPGGGTTGGPE